MNLFKRPSFQKPRGFSNPVLSACGADCKTGRDDTKYAAVASPHSELPDEAMEAWEKVQAEGFNINELFVDGEQFKPSNTR